MIPLLFGAALAAGVHTGIPVHGVEGVGEPSFLTPASGWSAAVPGGWVRVYVGATEADGAAWYARALESIGVAPPVLADLAEVTDAANGDGDTLVAFRDGNVGVLVRADHGARAVADRLRAAIVDGVPAALAPHLDRVGERWECHAPASVHLSFTGGRAVPYHVGVFTEPPREVVAWDAWGRATVIHP